MLWQNPPRPARAWRLALPRLEALEDRIVPTAPQLVSDTTAYPWRAVVRIESHFPKESANEYTLGTGVLIDSFHVLTAGHVIFDTSKGGWADNVLVAPGQNGDSTPLGDAFVTVERTFDNFISVDRSGGYNEHGDLALLTLDSQIGNTTGWLSVGYQNDPTYFTGLAMNSAGYPGEQGYSGDRMYQEYGPILGESDDGALLDWNYSTITAIPGQSGSPLWVYNPDTGQRTVYGVLVSGDDTAMIGYGSRITQGIYQDLTSWMASDPLPANRPSSSTIMTASFTFPPVTGTGPGQSTSGNVVNPTTTSSLNVGIGGYDPYTATWNLRSADSAGPADVGTFTFGNPYWYPVVGDWNGDGTATVGSFDPGTGTWYLRNSNSAGPPSYTPFAYGAPGWIPVVGDWNGDGTTSIGVFDPSTATWYLRNSNSAGFPDITPFRYGAPGWIPVVGDWNGSGRDGIGMFDPTTATWYLRNETSSGFPDITPFQYGLPGWQPVTGHWNGGPVSGIGVVYPVGSEWFLRDTPGPGVPTTPVFSFGAGYWLALSGDWVSAPDAPRANGTRPSLLASAATAGPAAPASLEVSGPGAPAGAAGLGGELDVFSNVRSLEESLKQRQLVTSDLADALARRAQERGSAPDGVGTIL